MGKKATAILKKCRKEDIKDGKMWCIYQHDPSNKSKMKDPQGKGWPKHYDTKEDASKALRMMKTFGSSVSELGESGLSKLSIDKDELVEQVIEKLLGLKQPQKVDELFKEFKIKDFSEIENLDITELNKFLKKI
jgi:hypothetical protein